MTQQASTEIVVAHPTDHESLGPKLGGGHGLVSSLTACLVHPGVAGQRLALSRPIGSVYHDVQVQTAKNRNSPRGTRSFKLVSGTANAVFDGHGFARHSSTQHSST